MASKMKKKYVPDIAAQNAKQEQNFWRLVKLLPEIENKDQHIKQSLSLTLVKKWKILFLNKQEKDSSTLQRMCHPTSNAAVYYQI